MALIDLASYKPKGNELVFAYRYPQTNLSTYTQLVVYESQEALFFSKGQLMGKFGPGKHTLTTENLPLLRSLYGIPFGGKNPFTAEIWIVNKLLPTNLPWNVDRMTIHDADYNTQLPLTASGQYGIRISDSERFLINLVGTKDVFTDADMTSQMRGEFTTKTKSAIMKFMMQNNVGFKRISAFLDELSSYAKEQISDYWRTYGIDLTKFYISTIEIDDSTPDGKLVKDSIAQQASMSITGHSWQQEKTFDLANNAVDQFSSMSGSGGLLGSLMALNMMNGMGGGAGLASSMGQPVYNQPTFSGTNPNPTQTIPPNGGMSGMGARLIYCWNCSKKRYSNERFCPQCGSEYTPCPRCGADNSPKAKRCTSCGTPLQSDGPQGGAMANCPRCGAGLMPGAKFCPSCGASVAATIDANVCAQCGSPMAPGAKFCPNCGHKR